MNSNINKTKLIIYSGGQTGVDIAAWKAAKASNLDTFGYMPRGFKTQDGNRYEYKELYGAVQTNSSGYQERTHKNAGESDCTIWYGYKSPGYYCTLRGCLNADKPFFDMSIPGEQKKFWNFLALIQSRDIIPLRINCAGNRECSYPGIETAAYDFFIKLFERIKSLYV